MHPSMPTWQVPLLAASTIQIHPSLPTLVTSCFHARSICIHRCQPGNIALISRSIRDRDSSTAANLMTSGSSSIRRRDSSTAANLMTSALVLGRPRWTRSSQHTSSGTVGSLLSWMPCLSTTCSVCRASLQHVRYNERLRSWCTLQREVHQ